MKSLNDYILEASNIDVLRLDNVIAPYDVQPNIIVLEAPETYSESDIQIYVSDRFLQNMPTADKYADNFFGVNKDNIYDVRFEYESFEHLMEKPHEMYVNWDPKYDTNLSKDVVLHYFKITNLKYIIEFDKFDLEHTDQNNARKILVEIFKTTESNAYNKYDLSIKFDENNLKFKI